jgi:hypothetical protein
MTLIKRLTLVVKNGVVGAVHYPIFPSDSDPDWVIGRLKTQWDRAQGSARVRRCMAVDYFSAFKSR